MAKTSTNRKNTPAAIAEDPAKKTAELKKSPTLKKTAAPKKVTVKTLDIEAVCELALAKLRDLDIEHPLQADLQWCLGSYRGDGNPIGLFQMAERALAVFQREKAAGNKSIPAKLISDLSKSLKP